ncbi:MAG: methylenetetrahydrofolate--tRNA-(uracil(54)-C(5))-methyltransferase (FADH(2)-oxidizing) TrmFO [Clostridia bacterium]|nr:methylenetetrahydrofolate--tRNA-(uracil(54)-C(5))-methyltransferase (FADH(2)-oxidizing) TrmFO [Clostridia bacterium]
MYFDTHAHYDDNRFDSDRDELLSAMPDSGVGCILVPGCDVKSSENALALAERWDFIYAAVGIHPEDMGGMQEGDLERIEALAKRGADAIRYGPMKPVGLTDPATGRRPGANLQLRKENSAGTLLNLVGFQTNLKFGEQKRVFSMIPALENAEFVRYGVMHRNTFLDSPRVLRADFSVKDRPELFFAGQITGTEGYMESAAGGIIAGINAARRLRGRGTLVLPRETMIGALQRYISDATPKTFQPMGAAFGLLPPLDEKIRDKRERYAALAERSLELLALTDTQ